MNNNIKPSKKSLEIVQDIATTVPTFHHHYHILYDIASSLREKWVSKSIINYVEIGAYAGASACMMLQHPLHIKVVSIDLGEPISKEQTLEYVMEFKTNINKYRYIKANSQDPETKNILKSHVESIDILFIDGDHSFSGVNNDFNLYTDMISQGGYVVFDDYRDPTHSPDVKLAVDAMNFDPIVWNVIGTLPNTLEAYPKELTDGNCFIIQKL